jgi:hypothetical protein
MITITCLILWIPASLTGFGLLEFETTSTPEFGQVLVGTMIVGSPVGWTFPGVFRP